MLNAEQFDEHMERVASLLGVKIDKMYDLILDHGRLWLLDHTGDHKYVAMWESLPEFWVWWRQIWMQIDDALFAPNGPIKLDGSVIYHAGLYDYYVKAHTPGNIKWIPTHVVFAKFHQLLKKMVVEQNQFNNQKSISK